MPSGKKQASSKKHSSHGGTRPEPSRVTVARDEQAQSEYGQDMPDYSINNRADYWMQKQTTKFGPFNAVGEVTVTEEDYYNTPYPKQSAPSISTQGSATQENIEARENGQPSESHHNDHDYTGYRYEGYDHERQDHIVYGHKSHEHMSREHKGQDHKIRGHKSYEHNSSDHKAHDFKSHNHRGHGSSTDARTSGQKKPSGKK